MTKNEALQYIQQHPNKRFIIRDDNEPNPDKKYMAISFQNNLIYRGCWRSIRSALKPTTGHYMLSIMMCDKDGQYVTRNEGTNCSILSDEEIALALL